MSFCLFSCHFIFFVSCHFVSVRVTSFHSVSFYFNSCCFVSFHFVSFASCFSCASCHVISFSCHTFHAFHSFWRHFILFIHFIFHLPGDGLHILSELLPSCSQQRTPNLSGHCGTSNANSKSQWDLNYKLQISVGTATEIWRWLRSGSAHVRGNGRRNAR